MPRSLLTCGKISTQYITQMKSEQELSFLLIQKNFVVVFDFTILFLFEFVFFDKLCLN